MSGGHGETLGDGHYTRVLRCLDNRRVHCPTQYQHEVQEDVSKVVAREVQRAPASKPVPSPVRALRETSMPCTDESPHVRGACSVHIA